MQQSLSPALIRFQRLSMSPSSHLSNGEVRVLEHFLSRDGVVFDVGGFHGDWTACAAQVSPSVTYHIFEADSVNYESLLKNDSPHWPKSFIPNNVACFDSNGALSFFRYPDSPSWNTACRRVSVEKSLNIPTPTFVEVPCVKLDSYCTNHKIPRIDYLKIDAEGAEFKILQGAKRMLSECRIDMLQFEYGGTFQDAGTTLREVFHYLQDFGYDLYKMFDEGLVYYPRFEVGLEDYCKCVFFVAHNRLRGLIQGHKPKMIDLPEIFGDEHIFPKGVVHVGAHEGAEVELYLKLGFTKILLIEANPLHAENLVRKFANTAEVKVVHCAATSEPGFLELNVTSGDGQSSSILALGKHSEIYPTIKVESRVKVLANTIDNIILENQLQFEDYNFLNIDIQGAELLALTGAAKLLEHIDAINTEVNFAELYEGCAIFYDLEAFLLEKGMKRVCVTTPWHKTWGDGFYTRKSAISMANFGYNGRFGNQVFQYIFLKCFASVHDANVEIPAWPEGEVFFGIQSKGVTRARPVFREPDDRIPDVHRNFDFRDKRLVDHDLSGYFQFHTSNYRPYKSLIQSTLKFIKPWDDLFPSLMKAVLPQDATVVALHIRRGDYGNSYFFRAPTSWYVEWLRFIWKDLSNPVLYIASDELESVLPDFEEFNPYHAGSILGSEQQQLVAHPFDFYMLSTANVVAISNSSFSFMASMLNNQSRFFMRPHLPTRKLTSFDPWSAAPLLFHRIEDFPL